MVTLDKQSGSKKIRTQVLSVERPTFYPIEDEIFTTHFNYMYICIYFINIIYIFETNVVG